MNLRALIELSVLLSAHSPLLIDNGKPLPREALARFWFSSRVRTRLWVNRLHGLIEQMSDKKAARPGGELRRAVPLLADVLAGDITARLWSGVLMAVDHERETVGGGPVARSLLSHQQIARNLVLHVLNVGSAEEPEELREIDGVRRRLERWNDLLVGHLVRRYGLAELAFVPERAMDFGVEQLADGWQPEGMRFWDLTLLGLRTSFPEQRLPQRSLGDLRQELIQAMLGCFGSEAFDEQGALRSVRVDRLLNAGREKGDFPLSWLRRAERWAV